MTEYYARSPEPNSIGVSGEYQLLQNHLLNVANRAKAKMVSAFQPSDGELAYLVGLHHDDGKYQDSFQRLLTGVSSIPAPHASVGAAWFREHWENPQVPKGESPSISLSALAGTVIANHHRYIRNYSRSEGDSSTTTKDQFEKGTSLLRNHFLRSHLLDLPSPILPTIKALPVRDFNQDRERKLTMAWYTRFLYSAIVDADVEDAIAHRRPSLQQWVDDLVFSSPEELNRFLLSYMKELRQRSRRTKINRIRNELWDLCLPSADGPPGVYTLSAPTGSGKTLLAAGWALRHQIHNGLRRVIYCAPYVNIDVQSAREYRSIFGADNVLEHQSDIDPVDNTFRNRRVASNWNAPFIVTTMLQLFESLRSNKAYRLRKLHNIPKSVILLDEAQVLDPKLLRSTVDSIKRLQQVGCTIVFLTATQPALGRDSLSYGLE